MCGHIKMRCLWLAIGFLSVSVSGRDHYERIGYFWHITDIHYDGHFNSYSDIRKGCWRPDYDGSSGTRAQRKPLGPYGDYSCDATWELIESAAKMIMTRQNDNVEFVLWTGNNSQSCLQISPRKGAPQPPCNYHQKGYRRAYTELQRAQKMKKSFKKIRLKEEESKADGLTQKGQRESQMPTASTNLEATPQYNIAGSLTNIFKTIPGIYVSFLIAMNAFF